jgi:hypothetical protein
MGHGRRLRLRAAPGRVLFTTDPHARIHRQSGRPEPVMAM